MNRFSKGFRTLGGICILLNLVAFFLPMTQRVQKNYGTLTWTEFDYLKSLFEQRLPAGEGEHFAAAGMQSVWILLLMILPLLLSLAAGIWGIVGSFKQKISSIAAFAVLTLYAAMSFTVSYVWPEAGSGQTYCLGYAHIFHLAVSGAAAVMAIAALLSTPKKVRTEEKRSAVIPQVEEIKQQQIEAKYNIIMEEANKTKPQQAAVKPYVPGPGRGVLVFLTGIYAGAEIPLTDGELINLGRHPSNHLVFENQMQVSRRHCQIRWEAARGKFIFKDFSSTGSYVNDSSDCMPQNLELDLEPGMVIALGNEENSFRLE